MCLCVCVWGGGHCAEPSGACMAEVRLTWAEMLLPFIVTSNTVTCACSVSVCARQSIHQSQTHRSSRHTHTHTETNRTSSLACTVPLYFPLPTLERTWIAPIISAVYHLVLISRHIPKDEQIFSYLFTYLACYCQLAFPKVSQTSIIRYSSREIALMDFSKYPIPGRLFFHFCRAQQQVGKHNL